MIFISQMIITAGNLKESRKALELAKTHGKYHLTPGGGGV